MKYRLPILLALLLFMAVPAVQAQQEEHIAIAEQVRGIDSSSTGFVADLLTWYDSNMNYTAVGALMTIESSFIPFPSEVVIPPAVYVACNPETKGGMKIWLIVLIGTLGAMLGAFINYFLSRWLGRPIIYAFADSRVGHLLRLSKEKIVKAEDYFNDHGNISTLVGRLIPVIRQLISIPAGLSKMNIGAFALYTFIGAAVWNCILALLGYLAYQAADPSIIERYSKEISVAIVVIFAVVVAILILRAIFKKQRQKKEQKKVRAITRAIIKKRKEENSSIQ